MKTIGMLGGMSWESTVPYYARVNELVRERLGGLHSAKVAMVSVDFAPVVRLQDRGEWDEAGWELAAAARAVENAGADFVLLCTNTMHRVAPAIEAAVDIPLLHIADPTAEAVLARGIRTVGLLGTRFTMEEDFYRGRLTERHGLEVLVPVAVDREVVHRVIYDELCMGIVSEQARLAFRGVIDRLVERGAQGLILGCTEIAMIVGAGDSSVPVFDTTMLHATAAVDLALA